MKVTVAELRGLVQAALERAGANATMAEATARALVLAEAQGIGSHGLSRVAQYVTHLRNGRVDGAAQPVLQGAWLRDGAHVNLIGAHRPVDREADTATIARSSVYVDLMQSAMNEAGDLLIPIAEGAFARERIVGELGQLAAGQIAGRTNAAQITLFKSLGIVAQDLFAAWAVLQRAEAAGIGTLVAF